MLVFPAEASLLNDTADIHGQPTVAHCDPCGGDGGVPPVGHREPVDEVRAVLGQLEDPIGTDNNLLHLI